MRKLDKFIDRRRECAHAISEGIRAIKGITPVCEDKRCYHSYHLYTLCVEDKELGAKRDDLMRQLYYKQGVQCIQHYQPTYDFTGFRKMGYKAHLCPRADEFFYRRGTNLPIHPMLTDREVKAMIDGIRRAALSVRQ